MPAMCARPLMRPTRDAASVTIASTLALSLTSTFSAIASGAPFSLHSAATAVAPNQYKLSQAGWDSQGWTESRAAWRRGETDRPRAAFTILQVGNNPGIYVIAAGGVLMSVGIPWAFYVKPWILRRRKRKIQMSLETGATPAREALETAR